MGSIVADSSGARSSLAFGLAALVVVATAWLGFARLWEAVIGPGLAALGAAMLSLGPAVVVREIRRSATDGSEPLAGYVLLLGATVIGFLLAVWVAIVSTTALAVGAATATSAATTVTFAFAAVIAVGAVPATTAVGSRADWALVCRMVVALLSLALVTVALLTVVWVVAFVGALFASGRLAPYVAWLFALLALWTIADQESDGIGVVEACADATPIPPDERPEIHAKTAAVASQLDVPIPTIAIADTAAPEAMVVGFRPSNVHLVLSEGTLSALEGDELEAVIAHELAHVANRDAMVMTAVSAPVVLANRLRTKAYRTVPARAEDGREIRAYDRRHDRTPDIVLAIATAVWAVSHAIAALLSRERELAADRTAATVTGKPAALAGALRTLDERIAETPVEDLRTVAGVSALSILPLEPADLEADERFPWSLPERLRTTADRLFRTHPPTERRLAELEEFERERR